MSPKVDGGSRIGGKRHEKSVNFESGCEDDFLCFETELNFLVGIGRVEIVVN